MIYEPHIECATAERLRHAQASRLRAFLTGAAARIPSYCEIITAAGLGGDIKTLGDDELLARFGAAGFTGSAEYVAIDAYALREIDRRLFFLETTSGTTAAPKSRYATREDDLIDQRMLARSFAAFGVSRRDRVVTVDIGELGMYALMTKALAELGTRDSLFYCARRDFSRSMKQALAYGPDVLITVPSVLARSLAGFIDGLGAARSVKKLIYYAEPLDGKLRRWLREEYGVESFSLYSSVECGIIGAECEAHAGVHLWADCVLPGLKDASPVDQPVFESQGDHVLQGTLALTTMMHAGKPTLAYLTGDEVQYTEAPCACGRTLPRIAFVRRETEVFSLYGSKFTYQQIHDIVYEHADAPGFLQVILEDGAGGTDMTLVLAAEGSHWIKERRNEIYHALMSHPLLSFVVGHGVVDFHFEFVPENFFTGRKIRKVEDRRAGSAMPATARP